MPSKSKAQHNLMAAVANNPKFAKKAGIPQNVGADYMKADKKVKKYNMGGVMAHDKKELRNLSDEDYRIRNRSVCVTAASISDAVVLVGKIA